MRLRAPILLILALAACQSTGGIGDSSRAPYAPTGLKFDAPASRHLEVGHQMMLVGDYEGALSSYSRAAARDNFSPDSLSAMGSANLRLGRLGQSERLLRRAVKADQTFVPALNNLGVVLMETGQFGEAVGIFRRAFALDNGESEEIRNNLRLALAKFEDPEYYDNNNESEFALVRQGSGHYLLKTQP